MKKVWYVQMQGSVAGPYTAQEVTRFVQAGRIERDTRIRCRADGKWIAAGTVRGLFPEVGTGNVDAESSVARCKNPMKLKCDCDQKYTYDHTKAGQQFKCSWCGYSIVMPRFEQLLVEDQSYYRKQLQKEQEAAEKAENKKRLAAEKQAASLQKKQQLQKQRTQAVDTPVSSPPRPPILQPEVLPPAPHQPQTNIQVNVPLSQISNSLGIGAIVLGCVGTLAFCIPIVSVPLLGIGLLLGIAGIILAIRRQGTGIGFSIAGTAICGIVLLPSLLFLFAFVSAMGTGYDSPLDEPYSLSQDVEESSTFPETQEVRSSFSLFGKPVVTQSEYSRIKNGMSYREVVNIIGSEGEEISSNRIEGVPGVMDSVETVMHLWQNGDGTSMNAMFQNDKLMQKSQFGLK